jgi:hypothetical protein
MTTDDKAPDPDASSRKRARLRFIGVLMLLLGMGGASLVYWLGTRSGDPANDPTLVGYDRAESRQMGVLYGKMGLLIEDLTEDLKRPRTQAILIATVAAFVAAGCFYFARLPDPEDDSFGQ